MKRFENIPMFPVTAFMMYLYDTSIEDYFNFLDRKVTCVKPSFYLSLRQMLCWRLGVNQTDSMRILAQGLHRLLVRERYELYKLEDEYNDDDDDDDDLLYLLDEKEAQCREAELAKQKAEKNCKIREKEQSLGNLFRYIWYLFVKPLRLATQGSVLWDEQEVKQNLVKQKVRQASAHASDI